MPAAAAAFTVSMGDATIDPRPDPSDAHIEIEDRDARVVITLADTVLADSAEPCLVRQSDTGVARYYLPPTDVRLDLLEQSATRTDCPLKGTATYLSARVDGVLHPDVAWTYAEPLPAVGGIAGYVSFADDAVHVTIGPRAL